MKHVLSYENFIIRLSKDAAIFSSEFEDIKRNWTHISSIAEELLSMIPDTGHLSRGKRLQAYQAVDRKLDTLVQKSRITEDQKDYILLLLSYSGSTFERAWDADIAAMKLPVSGRVASSTVGDRVLQEKNENLSVDCGGRVFLSKQFVYRIPIVIRLFFGSILAVMMLEETGYTSLFPSGALFSPLFTIAFYVVMPILVLSPYRDSYIKFRDSYFVLPSLYIPPFKRRSVCYKDIQSMNRTYNQHSVGKLRIKTSAGSYSISGYHCNEFDKLAPELEDRVDDARKLIS